MVCVVPIAHAASTLSPAFEMEKSDTKPDTLCTLHSAGAYRKKTLQTSGRLPAGGLLFSLSSLACPSVLTVLFHTSISLVEASPSTRQEKQYPTPVRYCPTATNHTFYCQIYIDFASTSVTWMYEDTEMEMREITNWAAVVSFEVPDSDGQLAQLYYSRTDERLQEFRLGAELYHVEYNSDGDVLDVSAEEPEDRRFLLSEEQQEDYHLPAWLNPEALEGAAVDRMECSTCRKMIDVVCESVDTVCKIRSLPGLARGSINLWFAIPCKGVGLICRLDLLDTPVCTDYFCCGRSKCHNYFGGGACYEEPVEQCCDGSVVDGLGCCPGLEQCGETFFDVSGISSCFNPDVEKCCPATETWPNMAVGMSECCPSQVRLCDGRY